VKRSRIKAPKYLAEGGLLTESIDNDEFHEMVMAFKNYSGVRWSEIIDYIYAHIYAEVDAQVEFFIKSQQVSAPPKRATIKLPTVCKSKEE
jgi:hypothetical protein